MDWDNKETSDNDFDEFFDKFTKLVLKLKETIQFSIDKLSVI